MNKHSVHIPALGTPAPSCTNTIPGHYTILMMDKKLDRLILTVPERVNPIPRRAPPTTELTAPLLRKGTTNDFLAIANFCLVAEITESTEKLTRPVNTA